MCLSHGPAPACQRQRDPLFDAGTCADKPGGDARLGSVIDCFARPGAEFDVVHAATRSLEARGVDVIVTNQAHESWCRAFGRAGWMNGPSNFAFASAPALTARLSPFDQHRSRFHLTRGDGEGPTHL